MIITKLLTKYNKHMYNYFGDGMNILKFKKKNKDEYEIYLDNDTKIKVYEETIMKHNLLLKKYISEEELEQIKLYNQKASIYSVALKYIGIRMRSEKEIRDYLLKKEYDNSDIEIVIKKLRNNKLINDEEFVKAYINDKLLMTNYGPYKIKGELLKHQIDENIINKYIDSVDQNLLLEKIEKIVNKYTKSNKKHTTFVLKRKLMDYLNTLGYPNYLYSNIVNNIEDVSDNELLKKEVEKQYNKLSKKYNGKELELKIITKLYQKGFNRNEIDIILEQYSI